MATNALTILLGPFAAACAANSRFIAPHWVSLPTLDPLVVGSAVSLSGGSAGAVPTATYAYQISVNGVAQTWPYTIQQSDQGKIVRVLPVATSMGVAVAAPSVISGTVPLPGQIVPGAVSNVTFTNISTTGLSVSCSAPTTGGVVDNYNFAYRVFGSSGAWTTVSSVTPSATITGLATGTTYAFSVTASNGTGSSSAVTASQATIASSAPYTPPLLIGQNAPGDTNYSGMPIFTNRLYFEPQNFYTNTSFGTVLSAANQDPVTGLPTSAFALKFLFSVPAINEPLFVGDWVIIYKPLTTGAKLTLAQAYSGLTIVSDTYDSSTNTGVLRFTNPGIGNQIGFSFSGGVTSLICYSPADAAKYFAGQTVPLFTDAYLDTVPPFPWIRFMDWSGVNGMMITSDASGNTTGWTKNVIEYEDLPTPATYCKNFFGGVRGGYNAGYPLEWQVALCNATGKDGWFCFEESLSDTAVSKMVAYIAANLNPGLKAIFETGNEQPNYASGFMTYRKAGYFGQMEAQAVQATAAVGVPAAQWYMPVSNYVKTFSCDGAGTVTLVYNEPHSVAMGADRYIQVRSLNSGYSGYAPLANAKLTVVDGYTVTYPCSTSTAASGTPIAGTTVLAAAGFVALNGGSTLFGPTRTWIGSLTDFSRFYHIRRVMENAITAKAAWVAAGRSASDILPVLVMFAGDGYRNGGNLNTVETYFAFLHSTLAIKDVFAAVSVGGYMAVDQSFMNGGFGFTGKTLTPTDYASTKAQMQVYADYGYGANNYTSVCAWAADQGIEVFGYEIGTDTVGTGNESTAQDNDRIALNQNDDMRVMLGGWLRWLRILGFTRVAYYQCGVSGYSGVGCFAIGQTISEIRASTPTAQQSPKFRAIIEAQQPFTQKNTWHAVPCTLSGYDIVGNEGVKTVPGAWPNISGSVNGQYSQSWYNPNYDCNTYFFWSEIHQTMTMTLGGDYNVNAAHDVEIANLRTKSANNIHVAALAGTNVTLGSCPVELIPGANYIRVRALTASRAATTYIRSVDVR